MELFAKTCKLQELFEYRNGDYGKELTNRLVAALFELGNNSPIPESIVQTGKIREKVAAEYERAHTAEEKATALSVSADIAIQVERKLPGSTFFRFPDSNKIQEVM